MDLSALYELRDRLKSGIMAGAQLLPDDYRLRRALDDFASLEGSSPVFQKVSGGVRAALAPDCPNPAGALLEALSLCDAVLTTQGAVSVPGPHEPLELPSLGSALTSAPYSVIHPLLDALTSTGAGKASYAVTTLKEQPRLLEDYRVLKALVSALGSGYLPLADLAQELLTQAGSPVLPLVKNGFDPEGKKEMVRRLHIVEDVAGPEENAWYLSLIDAPGKEVRRGAVYALRRDAGNAEQLVSLAKSGKAKQPARWALSTLDVPVAWEFWTALAAKKPMEAADYLVLSTAPQASSLIAGMLNGLLDDFSRDQAFQPEALAFFKRLMSALPGKSGPRVCAFYYRAATMAPAIDQSLLPNKRAFLGYGGQHSFQEHLPRALRASLLYRPEEELAEVALELYRGRDSLWLAPALVAALLTKPADAAYEIGAPLLQPPVKARLEQNNRSVYLMQVRYCIGGIQWDEEAKRQVYRAAFHDPFAGKNVQFSQPLYEPLSIAWYRDLAELGMHEANTLLVQLIRPGDQGLCAFLGRLFHTAAVKTGDFMNLAPALRKLGWTECRDLAFSYFKKQNRTTVQGMKQFALLMPGSAEDRAAEIMRVVELVESRRLVLHGSEPISEIRPWLARMLAGEFEGIDPYTAAHL